MPFTTSFHVALLALSPSDATALKPRPSCLRVPANLTARRADALARSRWISMTDTPPTVMTELIDTLVTFNGHVRSWGQTGNSRKTTGSWEVARGRGSYEDATTVFPPVVDYRWATGVVSPVKDQGDCGSCWAFSSAESLESQLRMNGHLVNVSAQNFVDCVQADAGCGGGWMDDALAYAEKTGVENASTYPYTGTGQPCASRVADATVRPTMYMNVAPSDDALRRALLTVGPVSIALDATFNFQTYSAKDYIFNDATCDPTTPDHALLLVGYNDVERYWIVKNSWNTDWGREGYIYINNTLPNVCGISGYAVVPYVRPVGQAAYESRVKAHLCSVTKVESV